METKEISTVVEKITDPSKISRLALADKGALLRHITGLHDSNFINAILPLTGYPGISLNKDEQLVYLGLRDKDTRKFLETPSHNAEGVFKILPNNRIVTVSANKIALGELINATDLNRISKHYTISFEDLLATKEVLGLYKKKMAFAGALITEYELGLFEIYTLNNTSSYVMSTELPGLSSKHNSDGKVKFCIRDLVFKSILNKKGYNLPKDRTVKIGSRVIILNNSKIKSGVVHEIIPSKLIYTDKKGREIKSNTFHILSEEGVLIRLRRKDFKII